MVSNKDRMIEWLNRTADEVYALRRKPNLSKDKALYAIRGNYNVISVLIKVAQGDAFMLGIKPPDQS
jgi:hypothetical protein